MSGVQMLPAAAVGVVSVVLAIAAASFKLVSAATVILLFFAALVLGCGVALLQRAVFFLGQDEQLKVEGLQGTKVHNGPGITLLNPFMYKSAESRKAVTLGNASYARLLNIMDGAERIEKGPQLLFLGAYDELRETCGAKVLSDTDYLIVEDQAGKKRIEQGPCMWFPKPHEQTERGQALSLGRTEYIIVEDKLTGTKKTVHGPCVWFPEPYDKVASRNSAHQPGSTEYLVIEDKLTSKKRIVRGPCMWFPEPDEVAEKGQAISLSQTEYIVVEDKLTGDKKTVRGPCVWYPEPYDVLSKKSTAHALQDDEYLRIKDTATGQRWIQKGKALVFPEPTWKIETCDKAWALKAYEYIRLVDTVTGKVRTERGEKTVFPSPDEELMDGEVMRAIDLKVHEYVKVLDQSTGEVRVESGAATGTSKQVFLGPNDKVLDNGKKRAIEVDEDHAVLVRDKATGQCRLVTEKLLFVPEPNETIEEVKEKIKLADHEAMIVKDKDGQFHYYYGSDEKRAADQERSFFLPPYAEVVQLCWSKGRRRESRTLMISRFDCRPQFMSFEFNCRTADNVELILEGTFFWEVVDLPAMVRSTGDTSGDLCNHARSQFIRHVARVTLKQFMDESHAIAKKVWEEDTGFFKSRGVKIHSLEVTRYQCADQRTSEILEQIIQETTNRMNRLSQAESENEVSLFRTQGQIEQERMNGELLKIQHEHSEAEAKVNGQSEAARIQAFMSGLDKTVPKLEDRVFMWQTLRKTEALQAVSEGGAQLYYTPSDVNLSIEAKRA